MNSQFNNFNLLKLRSNQTLEHVDKESIQKMRRLVSGYLRMSDQQIKIAKANGYQLEDLLALQGKTLHDFRNYLAKQLQVTVPSYVNSVATLK